MGGTNLQEAEIEAIRDWIDAPTRLSEVVSTKLASQESATPWDGTSGNPEACTRWPPHPNPLEFNTSSGDRPQKTPKLAETTVNLEIMGHYIT